MSRVGKLPVAIPAGVNVEINGLSIKVSKGNSQISKTFGGNIGLKQENGAVVVEPKDNSKFSRAMWGTARSVINSMMKGVSEGFVADLNITGVGYRAAVKDKYLNLSLAKSHNTKIEIPESIKIEVVKPTNIKVYSHDKEKLGQFVSVVMQQRKVEPYKGKGITIAGQYIARKEGKKSK